MGFRILLAMALIGLPSLALSQSDSATKPTTLGIFPYVTPVQMVRFHRPLKEWLAKTLNRPVTLVSAPNFKEFVRRTQAGEYDYIMTAPHLGRLAEVRDGYQRLAHTMHEVQGVYLAPTNSDAQGLEDLEGKVITMVGPAAIITQMAIHQLRQLGLEDGKNVTFRWTRTHNTAMYASLRGESDASITGILLWNKIGRAERERVRVIGKTPVAPGFMIMAAERVPEEERQRVKAALLEFPNTEKGRHYCEATGFQYFDPIDDAEMQALDPYIQIFLNKK